MKNPVERNAPSFKRAHKFWAITHITVTCTSLIVVNREDLSACICNLVFFGIATLGDAPCFPVIPNLQNESD